MTPDQDLERFREFALIYAQIAERTGEWDRFQYAETIKSEVTRNYWRMIAGLMRGDE